MEETKSELKDECRSIWQQVQEADAKWQDTHEATTANDPETALIQIYQAKEKLLEARLEEIKNKDVEFLPTDRESLQEILKSELKESTEQLEQTLSLIRAQQAEQVAEQKRLRDWNKQMNMIKDSLTEKLEEAAQNPQQISEKSRLDDQERKFEALTKYLREMMKKLRDFVQLNFPPLTAEQTEKAKRKGKKTNTDEAVTPFCTLQAILEALMNQCVQSPHDPYIEIDPDIHWHSYIQLLLRCGIALRHPDRDNCIRLTAFHQ